MDVLRFNRGVKFSNAVSPISNEWEINEN
jgi:hypothetical protein